MRVGIPSYRRLDKQHTLATLERLGYKRDDIVISTQTEEEYRQYYERYVERAHVIYAPGENDSQNRNTLIEFFDEGEKFILADDDIKAFCELNVVAGKNTLREIQSKRELEAVLARQFSFSAKHNSPIFAWYPVDNPFFMKESIDLRGLLVGTILGIENHHSQRFDPRFALKGDFEIGLRNIAEGKNAVRFNAYTAVADHRSSGGCDEARKQGRNAALCTELIRMYPGLIKPGRRDGELAFIANRGTVHHR